jgi:hypothetical protein
MNSGEGEDKTFIIAPLAALSRNDTYFLLKIILF